MRQRWFENVDRRTTSNDVPGATPGSTGMAGHLTTREALRFAAASRAHDRNGRATLPHLNHPGLL
ncbi:hypothetical protein [Antricoccus suffuscus]|uniref:hypothetical protein n=1 Tax=Antricoccus suffuscus TaxID=1629062 RepID=UPI0011B209BF|nr:hypothetical protein [Antricoccus suffuscus]